jgi:hypothetical protein
MGQMENTDGTNHPGQEKDVVLKKRKKMRKTRTKPNETTSLSI